MKKRAFKRFFGLENWGVVVGIYQNHDHAKQALKIIRGHKHYKAGYIHRDSKGKVHLNLNYISKTLAIAIGSLIGFLLGLFFLSGFGFYKWLEGYMLLPAFMVAITLVGGTLAQTILYQFFSLSDSLIMRYLPRVMNNETILLVQLQKYERNTASFLIKDMEVGQPVIFVFGPEKLPWEEPIKEFLPREPLTDRKLKQRASKIAKEYADAHLLKKEDFPILEKLYEKENALRDIVQELNEVTSIERSSLLSTEWILDNSYIILGQAEDVRKNLPKKYYQKLPLIRRGSMKGLPRIYAIAKELVNDTVAQITEENIIHFLKAYQQEYPLMMAELWAIPLMIRYRLVGYLSFLATRTRHRQRESEWADFWANRLLHALRRNPDQLGELFADIEKQQKEPSPHFAEQLIAHLYDEEDVLLPIRAWLKRKAKGNLNDFIKEEQMQQAAEHVSVVNAINSLKKLASLNWNNVFEKICVIDEVLSKDIHGIYSRMDFDTRDKYRHAIEHLARKAKKREIDVAKKTLNLTEEKQGIKSYIGYYLIEDEGRKVLEKEIKYLPSKKERLRRFIRKYPATAYLTPIFSLTISSLLALLFLYPAQSLFEMTLFFMLSVIPASEIAVTLTNAFFTRFMPPTHLPKMCFKKGIPSGAKTLVIIPMMLISKKSIKEDLERLEVRFLANRDKNLFFGLFSDFCDAPSKNMPEDTSLFETVVKGIKQLNDKYNTHQFVLFHRERQWSQKQKCWMGKERKRGKLEHLNRFLLGENSKEIVDACIVGDQKLLSGITYVITLDSDTHLPAETARKMIETMAHPLNRPEVDLKTNTVKRGYGIIQPRVSTSLPSATASLFSRLFTDAPGTDPYTKEVSDLYQDLSKEGSYHGKGIYDLKTFQKVLGKRFPDDHLLSHDLLEGCFLRVGMATDIELLDSFPSDYIAYAKREHRWIRGDWQIADWLFAKTPTYEKKAEHNPLRAINRWKIADNLRRSLVPVFYLSLLVFGWINTSYDILWSVFVAFALFSPFFVGLSGSFVGRKNRQIQRSKQKQLLQIIARTAFIPHTTQITLDAIGRVFYRKFFSRNYLLEWETASESSLHSKEREKGVLFGMSWIPIASVFCAYIQMDQRSSLIASSLYLFLWSISPFIVFPLSHKKKRVLHLDEKDKEFLRITARYTWRYFDDFANEKNHFLPPDNYQKSWLVELARRTSPTNIGLYYLSMLSAHDLGYITLDQVLDLQLKSLKTVDRLERFKGHLLNWYRTDNLSPLLPKYVSTVDSGNFIACLWVVKHGIKSLIKKAYKPDCDLFSSKRSRGVVDTWLIAKKQMQRHEDLFSYVEKAIAQIDRILCEGKIVSSKNLVEILTTLKLHVDHHEKADAEQKYWVAKILQQVKEDLAFSCRYYCWLHKLSACPIKSEKLNDEIDRLQKRSFSLFELAHEDFKVVHLINNELKTKECLEFNRWSKTVLEEYERSKKLAKQTLKRAEEILKRIDKISEEIDLSFLYNPERKLFHIGYNVSDGRYDSSYYDLLASEARIASFIAIAKGQVPIKHWWTLGRPFALINRNQLLLSWGGTMFEYLMPVLIQKSFPGSLLDLTVRGAVKVQQEYGEKRGIPWGVSESAFSALDSRKIYQYRAFGVPGLGLKRGLEEDLVVSPYSTALALMVSPEESLDNLKKLSSIANGGMFGPYGFFEAIDFTRQLGPKGERGIIVHTYMAHHQGMSLVAINNLLNDFIMQKRFHSDPRTEAFEPLLYEKVPENPDFAQGYVREVPVRRLAPIKAIPATGKIKTANTPTPRCHLLSNGTLTTMVTNSGGGFIRWKGFECSRWRSDPTCDLWGNFCYIKDLETQQVWSNTYHPVRKESDQTEIHFTAEKAEFSRLDHQILTKTEVVVSHEDDVEMRRMTLSNHSDRKRVIELTTYTEPVLAPHEADRQHPAFNNLFIEMEYIAQYHALISSRRLRKEDDTPIYMAQFLVYEKGQANHFSFETSKSRFIGRARTTQNPLGVNEHLSNKVGIAINQIMTLRTRVEINPGERVKVAWITCVASTREEVLELIEKYQNLNAIKRAMAMAWSHAQLEMRHLRIHQHEAQLFQLLAGRILYPHHQLRASQEKIKQNVLGQSSLWPYGISGDVPIIVVTIGDINDIYLIQELLIAQFFFRSRGIIVDLVILDEEATGYDQPIRNKIENLVHSHSNVHREGEELKNIYILSYDQIPEKDLNLFFSVASAVLVAARGSLQEQLSLPINVPRFAKPLIPKKVYKDEKVKPLSFVELEKFNGFGGFTQDGKEYVIHLTPELETPAPWINVLANNLFGAIVTESGMGSCWYGNSQTNLLVPWSNDPISNPIVDAIYIRDDETGAFWNPTPSPIREHEPYRIRHGQGYSVFEYHNHGLEHHLKVFVPKDDPIRVQRLTIKNDSNRTKHLSVISYADLVLGANKEVTQMHVVTKWDVESQAIFAKNAYNPDYSGNVTFLSITPTATSYTADRTGFIGRNGSHCSPDALKRVSLNGQTGAAMDPCAALLTTIVLDPEEEVEIICLLGQTKTEREARQLIRKYQNSDHVDDAFFNLLSYWDHLLEKVQIQTPFKEVNYLFNRWFLYQTLSSRLYGRTGFYQASGAYGFRDQLQDVMSLLYTAPQLARKQILRAASRQFEEGDVQHWWHEPSGGGVRTKITDDLLWLPLCTAHYVKVTGDKDILKEEIPFLKGRILEEDEHEIYEIPKESDERATLLEHCRRAINKGLTSGDHGLPLIGGGDWNDGMNRVGIKGKGESVWLAWFLIQVMKDFADLLASCGKEEQSKGYKEQALILAKAIDNAAWDGNWYIRAYTDEGKPLGSAKNIEDKIDSLPQSWAVITAAADPKRAQIALQSLEKHLIKKEDRLVLLLTPPFNKTSLDPGYIKGYLPGVRENGGQYTHAALWVAKAYAKNKQGKKAVDVLQLVNPILYSVNEERAKKYRVEPYAVVADVYAYPGAYGRGGWTWYTGSAAWMYRVWLEDVLGFKKRGNKLIVDPVIPEDWKGFEIRYLFGKTMYHIKVVNQSGQPQGVAKIEVDSTVIQGKEILLEDDQKEHVIIVTL